MLGPWQAPLLGLIYLDFGGEQNVKCSARVHNGSLSAVECDSWVYSFTAVQVGGLDLKTLVAQRLEPRFDLPGTLVTVRSCFHFFPTLLTTLP